VNETVDRFRDWDAAYVLGALSSEDRRAYEQHLATCADCSSAVAELAGLPGILSKLAPDDAVALLTEDDILSGVDEHLRDGVHAPGLVQRLAVAASRRRRRIRFSLLGAAVAIIAIFVVGGIVIIPGPAPVVATVAMAPVHQQVITAEMQVTHKGWGTRFDWSCTYTSGSWESSTPVSYDLVVTQESGAQTTVATWSSSGPQAKGLSASSAIATGDIRSVEIRVTGTSTPLLRENL
jgi:Putative zinc-finger